MNDNNKHWDPSSLSCGLKITYNLPKRSPKPIEEPPIEKDENRIYISLANDSKEELQNKDIDINTNQITSSIQLIPYIFFNKDQKLVSSRYNYLKNPSEFDINQLNNPKELYYNLLNIIGFRLTKQLNTKIKLLSSNDGTYEEAKQSEWAFQRAEDIKQYLLTKWNISSNRIIILPFTDIPEISADTNTIIGKNFNRRVEIISDSPEILAPFKIKYDKETITPPYTIINSDKKRYKSLSVNVLQNNEKIKEFQDNDVSLPYYINNDEDIPFVMNFGEYEINVNTVSNNNDTISSTKKGKIKIQNHRIHREYLSFPDINDFNIRSNQLSQLSSLDSYLSKASEIVIYYPNNSENSTEILNSIDQIVDLLDEYTNADIEKKEKETTEIKYPEELIHYNSIIIEIIINK